MKEGLGPPCGAELGGALRPELAALPLSCLLSPPCPQNVPGWK